MSNFDISWSRRTSGLSLLITRLLGNFASTISVSPIIITLLSHLFVWGALTIVINKETIGDIVNILVPALLLLHLLVGFSLKFITKKSTGNPQIVIFVDHCLLLLNKGILVFIICDTWGISDNWLVTLLLASIYINSITLYYKLFKTGELVYPRLGYIESVVLIMLMVLLSYVPLINYTLEVEILGFSIKSILLFSVVGVSLLLFVKTIRNVPNVRYSLWMFCILLAISAAISAQVYIASGAIIVISLYAVLYAGKILTGCLLDGIERSPGLFTPALLIIVFFFPSLFQLSTLLVLIAYLIISNLMQLYKFIQIIKKLVS